MNNDSPFKNGGGEQLEAQQGRPPSRIQQLTQLVSHLPEIYNTLTLSLAARAGKKLPITLRVIARWSLHIKF